MPVVGGFTNSILAYARLLFSSTAISKNSILVYPASCYNCVVLANKCHDFE